MKKDFSISILKANMYGFIATLPSIIILVELSIYVWEWGNYLDNLFSLFFQNILLLTLVLFIEYILHVLIQGRTWKFFGNTTANAIKYTINRSNRAIYVYCKEPIELKFCRLGIVMPVIIVGLIPTLLGILIGNLFIFLFGLFGIVFANEDIAVLWLLRNIKAGSLVEDHPTRAGCYVIDS